MADLPMAQIPNFQLGATPDPTAYSQAYSQTANATTNALAGALQSRHMAQQIALARQAQAQKQHQDEVSSALQFLATTGQQLQYLRPDSQKLAISNSLNALAKVAPEFGIQPHAPEQIPEEAVDLVQAHAKLHQAMMEGKVSLPTYQAESSKLLEDMSMYERNLMKESQNITGTPNLQPGQVNGKSATYNPESGQVADSTGQPLPGQQGKFVGSGQVASIQNERQQSLQRNFQTITKDQQDLFSDYPDLQTSLGYKIPATNPDGTPHTPTQQEKDFLVAQQSIGLRKLAQIMNPEIRRMPNEMTLSDLSKSNLLPESIERGYDKYLKTGQPIPDTMQDSLLKAGTQLAVNGEKVLTKQEISAAQQAQQMGVDPSQVIQNFRSPQFASTSPFFPNQSTLQKPLIGGVHNLKVNGVGGTYQLLGNNPDPSAGNWQPVDQDTDGQ